MEVVRLWTDPKFDSVQLAPRIRGWFRPQAIITDVNGFDVEIELEAMPSDGSKAGSYFCRSLRVIQQEGGRPVTLAGIRSVPVAELVRMVAARVVDIVDEPTPGRRRKRPTAIPDGLAAQGPTDEVLRWVAFIYRMGLVLGESPTKRVREELGIKPATAGRWIARAREREFLGESEGPGKAGG